MRNGIFPLKSLESRNKNMERKNDEKLRINKQNIEIKQNIICRIFAFTSLSPWNLFTFHIKCKYNYANPSTNTNIACAVFVCAFNVRHR